MEIFSEKSGRGAGVAEADFEPLSVRAGAKMVESRRTERIGRLAGQLDPHQRQALAASLPALLEMARLAAQPPNRPTAPLPPTQ
ncbi:hypothetical protein [Streptomyces sp. NPDC002785]|uniref:hypothetical protein n=1 Tax=Streptomyces sp. NPDC002785 TaxID=3154543 RepID=UPI003331B446